MNDRKHLEKTRLAVIDSRTTLTAELERLGFEVLPSAANFIFTCHPHHDAAQLAAQLRPRLVIVCHFTLPRIEQHLSITLATNAPCRALVDALR